MFLSVIIAGFFAGISPFWGLIIIIAYGFRHFSLNKKVSLSLFIAGAAVAVFLFPVANRIVALSDAVLGVGLTAFLYFICLGKYMPKHIAFVIASGNGVAYGLLRQLLFSDILSKQVVESSKQSLALFAEMFSDNLEMYELVEQSMKASETFFTSYGTAVWFLIVFTALFLGSVWDIHRRGGAWKLHRFDLTYDVIYLLIAAMLLFIISPARIIGGNILLILLPYFLIQGIAVVKYFWDQYTSGKSFLLFFILGSILLNYVMGISLVMLGLADMWLMFREKHEIRMKSSK